MLLKNQDEAWRHLVNYLTLSLQDGRYEVHALAISTVLTSEREEEEVAK